MKKLYHIRYCVIVSETLIVLFDKNNVIVYVDSGGG